MLNLDPGDVRRRITLRTKAAIPVHHAGVGCDMDAYMELAEQYGLFIVEDAAQAWMPNIKAVSWALLATLVAIASTIRRTSLVAGVGDCLFRLC